MKNVVFYWWMYLENVEYMTRKGIKQSCNKCKIFETDLKKKGLYEYVNIVCMGTIDSNKPCMFWRLDY